MSDDQRKSEETRGLDRLTERLEIRRETKADARAEGSLGGQRARGLFEKLLTRVATGAIYAVVTIAAILLGRIPTLIVVAGMAWLCCSEFFHIARKGGRMPNEPFGLFAAVLFPLAAYLSGIDLMILVCFILIVACAIWYVFTPRATLGDVAITFFGPVYTSMTFSAIVLLRASAPGLEGAYIALGALGSIWLNDAVAYFAGSRFGRHKLAPRISPKKSWEGFVAGLIACEATWIAMGALGFAGMTMPLGVIGGVVVGFMSVIGDLFESRIKRAVGVKDSGTILPGHGGLLDRSDSILFGGLAAYFVLLFGGIL